MVEELREQASQKCDRYEALMHDNLLVACVAHVDEDSQPMAYDGR